MKEPSAVERILDRAARMWTGGLLVCLVAVSGLRAAGPTQIPAGPAWPGRISTVLGNGHDSRSELTIGDSASAAEVSVGQPFGVETWGAGRLLVCEVQHHRLWELEITTQRARIFALPGQGTDRSGADEHPMREPYEVRVDADGSVLVVEMQNHWVRRWDPATGRWTIVAGTGTAGYGGDGGPARDAMLRQPHSITLGDHHQLYIADIGNHRIRRVDCQTGRIESLAGDGTIRLPEEGHSARDQPVAGPRALIADGDTLWVALREGNSVWNMSLHDGRWHRVVGTGQAGYAGDGGQAIDAKLNGPKGIALAEHRWLYIADTENDVIRVVDLTTGLIRTCAGIGPDPRGNVEDETISTNVRLRRPHGVAVGPPGTLWIGDSENHRVRRVVFP